MNLNFKFSIARKISLGFGLLMIAALTTSIVTWITLDKNMMVNQRINKIYSPSANYLNDLKLMIADSKIMIKSWIGSETDDIPEKLRLRQVHQTELPNLLTKIDKIEAYWDDNERKTYLNINNSVDTLVIRHKEIMEKLNNYDAYQRPEIIFDLVPQIEDNGDLMVLTDSIVSQIQVLLSRQKANVEIANKEMDASFVRFKQLIILMAIIMAISVLLIGIYMTRTLTSPINFIKNILFGMSKGQLPDGKIRERSDEIGEMAQALNQLVNSLKKISHFSLLIGEGKFNTEFTPLGDKDILGNSLISMRDNLKKALEEAELRRIENNQRTWTSQGIARFSEILRRNNDDMEEFSYQIISNLVKYLEANQGGMFVINDSNLNEKFLELTAFYAYNRRKYLQKRIELGVTIVGQCVLEKETIYMTDIPKDYIRITSGLGSDTPTSLLVVPLITNDEVFGVVEIASFKPFEKYQIEFCEKVAENIASTIQSVKINNNTAKLLSESQEKSERLARQEEEMRQSIERMKTQQDEMIREHEEKYTTLKAEYEQKIRQLQNRITNLERKVQTSKITQK